MELTRIGELISQVSGVQGVALGGSHSRGEANDDSDYDIALYYANDLDTPALAYVLQQLDDHKRGDLLNPPGTWGPWINGGGWLTIDATPVDILLRDISRVKQVVKSCLAGEITIDYQCGHPFGFTNTIYAAETHYCRPLWQDASRPIDGLKALLYSDGKYPPRMQEGLIQRFLWEAEFSLDCGRKAALRGDINYAAGSFFRTVCSWLEVVYALNSHYLMNEKGALSNLDRVSVKPKQMELRVNHIYRLLADKQAKRGYKLIDDLHHELCALVSQNENS